MHAVGTLPKQQHKYKMNTLHYFAGHTIKSEDEHFPDVHPGCLRLAGWHLGLSHGTQAAPGFLFADGSHSRAQASLPADPSQHGEPFHEEQHGLTCNVTRCECKSLGRKPGKEREHPEYIGQLWANQGMNVEECCTAHIKSSSYCSSEHVTI